MNTVLVADDDPSMLHILTHLLTSEGFEVYQANNGIAALETARIRRPDLLVLDLIMPFLDGIGVLLKLFGESPAVQSPAILLTGQDSAEYKELFDTLSNVHLLEKPFDIDEFIALVHKCLEGGTVE